MSATFVDATGLEEPIAIERAAIERLCAELTMLRGFVGDVLMAHGYGEAGMGIGGIEADDLCRMLLRHGLIKPIGRRATRLGSQGAECIGENRVRQAHPMQ